MSDLKACSRCGRIHPRGYQCGPKRFYRETEERNLRHSSRWTRKSKQIREEAQGLCEVCRAQGIYTYNGLEVHHITKLSKDPEGLLNDENLICLCTRHHKEADEGKIDADYLRALARERGKL